MRFFHVRVTDFIAACVLNSTRFPTPRKRPGKKRLCNRTLNGAGSDWSSYLDALSCVGEPHPDAMPQKLRPSGCVPGTDSALGTLRRTHEGATLTSPCSIRLRRTETTNILIRLQKSSQLNKSLLITSINKTTAVLELFGNCLLYTSRCV